MLQWFQVDSDTPSDPKIKALLRRHREAESGRDKERAILGGLFALWCYVARHGKCAPGISLDSAGRPLPLQEMADEAFFSSVDELISLLTVASQIGIIDQTLWTSKQVVAFPAMINRADHFRRRRRPNLDFLEGMDGSDQIVDQIDQRTDRRLIEDRSKDQYVQTNKQTQKISTDRLIEARFAEFWAVWPRKAAKAEALKAFGQAGLGKDDLHAAEFLHETVIPAVRKQTIANGWDQPGRMQFIPHAASWLRAKRWEDEVIVRHRHAGGPGTVTPIRQGGGATGYDPSRSDAYAALQRAQAADVDEAAPDTLTAEGGR